MINTLSKTLEAQEKTQVIKHSPSTKIKTKPDLRSRRNELTEVTRRTDWTLAALQPNAPIKRLGNSRRQQQQPDAKD